MCAKGKHTMSKPNFDDVTAERKKIMKSIKSRDTKPEVLLRKALWREGYRYRKNYKALKGTPDIVLTKHRIVIFVDSEFFHGKDYDTLIERLKRGKRPEYWSEKIDKNIKRDLASEAELRGMGYTVLRFWGEDVIRDVDSCIKTIKETIWENSLQEMIL